MALLTDREKTAHLLRRFGLGASEAEVDYYAKDGIHGAINLLLQDGPAEDFKLDISQFANDKGLVPMPVAVDWWIVRMLTTRQPLREKMTLFWHDHFATSASKVQAAPLMVQQNEVLRRNALGDFPTLLSETSKDPAMLFWLDNQENRRGHANENFAREVMELFTLGIGNYTEKDVQEAARAFTGWSINRRPGGQRKVPADFIFRPFLHDDGEKTLLGHSGPLDGDAVLKILCEQPRCAEYITHKVWNWFVWPDPDAKTTAPLAKKFRDSGLNIKVLLRDIMESKEFYSPKAERTVVKNPVDFCVSTMRQLGLGQNLTERLNALGDSTVPRGILAPAQAAQLTMKGMGMWLMYPPDVAGWDIGESWITSATMVERMGWADKVFGQAKAGRATLRYPAYGLLQRDPSAQGVVKTLVSLFDAPIKPQKMTAIASAAKKQMGSGLTPENANAVAAYVTRLIFASPEFQFA